MRRFLSHLQRHGENHYHPDEYARRIGRDAFDALRALGVVIDAPPLGLLPCGMHLDECSREVFESETQPGTFVAECGRECVCDEPIETCEVSEVEAADLARVRASLGAFVRRLAEAHGLRDADVQRVESSPTFWSLGRAPDRRIVLFCTEPYARGFETLLLAQREPTLVLVPSRERVPASISQRYRAGERIEVRFLEEELALSAGRLHVLTPHAAPPTLGTRVVLDREGERRISDAEYEQFRVAHVDLVLDLTATTGSGGHPASVREPGGAQRDVSLPPKQALAIVELVRARGRALRAAELRCMREAQVNTPERLVELARQAVDVRVARYAWRAFHTIKGATPEAKAYAFRPPVDMQYAVVTPAS